MCMGCPLGHTHLTPQAEAAAATTSQRLLDAVL